MAGPEIDKVDLVLERFEENRRGFVANADRDLANAVAGAASEHARRIKYADKNSLMGISEGGLLSAEAFALAHRIGQCEEGQLAYGYRGISKLAENARGIIRILEQADEVLWQPSGITEINQTDLLRVLRTSGVIEEPYFESVVDMPAVFGDDLEIPPINDPEEATDYVLGHKDEIVAHNEEGGVDHPFPLVVGQESIDAYVRTLAKIPTTRQFAENIPDYSYRRFGIFGRMVLELADVDGERANSMFAEIDGSKLAKMIKKIAKDELKEAFDESKDNIEVYDCEYIINTELFSLLEDYDLDVFAGDSYVSGLKEKLYKIGADRIAANFAAQREDIDQEEKEALEDFADNHSSTE